MIFFVFSGRVDGWTVDALYPYDLQKHKSWRKTTQQFKNYEHSIYNK